MINGEKTKIAVYLLAIFLIGGIAGGFATSAFLKKGPRPPGVVSLSERQMARMVTELSLTDDQVSRIEPIVAEVADEIRTIRCDSMAEFARLYGELTERVIEELTPEQARIFRKIQAERQARAERMLRQHRSEGDGKGPGHMQGGWREHGGPPPGPPPPEPNPADDGPPPL